MNLNFKIKFAIIIAVTVIFSIFIIADMNKYVGEAKVNYQNTSVFDFSSIKSSFDQEQSEMYNKYKSEGLTLSVDSNIISLINSQTSNNLDISLMSEEYLENIYDFDISIVDSYDPSVDIHLSTLAGQYSQFTYNSVASDSNTVYAYSYSELPYNLYASVTNGMELEIITTELIWNYINVQFPSHNITLMDINNSGEGDEGDLLSEYEIYDYFINEDYHDEIFFITDSNIYFEYMNTYDHITKNTASYEVKFDTQYSFLGAEDQDTLNFFSTIFATEMITEYLDYINNNIYYDILSNTLTNSELNIDNNLINLLSSLDTIYVGVYEGQLPLTYIINDNFEGYYIEMFDKFAELFMFYDVNIEYVSFSGEDFDVNDYDNFIYTNYFKLTGERENYYFSTYSVENEYRIISKNDKTTYSDISEISGKVAFPEYLTDYEYLFDILPEENFTYCTTTENCISMLDNNVVEYIVIEDATVDYYSSIGKDYTINLAIHDLNIPGYISVPNTFSYAEELMEIINILYPTIDSSELFDDVYIAYNKYLIDYKEANTVHSNLSLFLVFYFIIILIITITILLDYKRQNSNTVNRIDKLVKVANIGILDLTLRKLDSVNEGETDSDPIQVHSNYNMINHLGITKYTFDDLVQRYAFKGKDFVNTIHAFSTNKSNNFKKIKQGTTIEEFVEILKKEGEFDDVTIHHKLGKSGVEKYLKYNITASKFRSKVEYNTIVDDTTHIYKQNELLKDLAYKDRLTGLYNITKLNEDFKNKVFYHYITLNISNFKFYNDSYSSSFADKLLKMFANKLTSLACNKCSIYRVIADEFIIMTKHKKQDDILKLIAGVKKNCSNIQVNNTTKVKLDMYFSITEYKKSNYKDFTQFTGEFEIKTQISKLGQRSYFISDDQIKRFSFSRNIQGEVFKLEDFKDFEIHLQPKVNPLNSTCVGAETLIRWKHPEHGIIPPLEFLDKFEKLERMSLLDEFVLNQTCIAYNKLYDKGLIDDNFVISFNLSAQSILEKDFVEMITTTLDRHKVKYKNIGIEILESFDLQNHKYLIKSFKELHDLGMKISIDDYGAGYSNVYTVSLLPFTSLKFDKSILDNIDTDEDKRKLFSDLVMLNRARGHELITEGVENSQQVEIIKDLKVKQIQGYFYSKPLNVDDFTSFIKSFNLSKK